MKKHKGKCKHENRRGNATRLKPSEPISMNNENSEINVVKKKRVTISKGNRAKKWKDSFYVENLGLFKKEKIIIGIKEITDISMPYKYPEAEVYRVPIKNDDEIDDIISMLNTKYKTHIGLKFHQILPKKCKFNFAKPLSDRKKLQSLFNHFFSIAQNFLKRSNLILDNDYLFDLGFSSLGKKFINAKLWEENGEIRGYINLNDGSIKLLDLYKESSDDLLSIVRMYLIICLYDLALGQKSAIPFDSGGKGKRKPNKDRTKSNQKKETKTVSIDPIEKQNSFMKMEKGASYVTWHFRRIDGSPGEAQYAKARKYAGSDKIPNGFTFVSPSFRYCSDELKRELLAAMKVNIAFVFVKSIGEIL